MVCGAEAPPWLASITELSFFWWGRASVGMPESELLLSVVVNRWVPCLLHWVFCRSTKQSSATVELWAQALCLVYATTASRLADHRGSPSP